MSLQQASLKGSSESRRNTERRQMEVGLPEFVHSSDDWPSAKVAKFAHAVCGFSKDQAERLDREKIDLATLADMSKEEIVHVTNCAWGDARRLKKAVETFVDKAAMFGQEAPTSDSKKLPISKERADKKSSELCIRKLYNSLYQLVWGLRVRVPAVFLLMHDEEGLCDKSLAVFDKSMGFQLPASGRLDSPKIFDTTKLQFTIRSGTSSEKESVCPEKWFPTAITLIFITFG
ncbi:hypothetical protein R1sor_000282 [Riccia sorocarpa]|uniref:Uncharacterized protein n=1 Tax=Riccia sorocarpa TaxID=122646 RepID=A0ABD3GSN7_9MARC